MTDPRPRACCWCGRPTTGRNVCRYCVVTDYNAGRVPDHTDALPAGDWVYDPRRGVQVYVKATR